MYDPELSLRPDKFVIRIETDSEDGMGGLKGYIDTDDIMNKSSDGRTKNGEIFRRTQSYSTRLRKAGREDLIFKALSYVRENY